MRDLTPEELSLAPEWATHYLVYYDGDICFESRRRRCIYSPRKARVTLNAPNSRISQECKKLPKEDFDIIESGLSDIGIEDVEIANCKIRMYLASNDLACIEHTKDDAIAIAKALGVTGEDLK